MAVSDSENDCINFVKMKFIDSILYFIPENDDNLESDYFGRIEHHLSIIRNLKNQVLFIDRKKQPVFEDMPDSDCADNEPYTTFNIHVYKDSNARGVPVAISVTCNGNHTLSCEDKTISFKEINPPDNINDTKSDIIFFQRSVPGHDDKMQFESSLYKGYFLACQKERNIYKLILKNKDEYGDKSVMFTVQNND
ncbi:interleukin-18 isoform X2 [Cavia porcellus]|uniref:Interleukin-18 n=2 Tax=Cavia porcellus TaxID=10141 RepID=D6RR58_CAVPO|nr:interleukin-18 [Cavia porcellus]XP_005004943.1 interleukin-18 isoform X1 [Cavia porcellus]BAC76898.1 IL-18 [Cavia porcellus]